MTLSGHIPISLCLQIKECDKDIMNLVYIKICKLCIQVTILVYANRWLRHSIEHDIYSCFEEDLFYHVMNFQAIV